VLFEPLIARRTVKPDGGSFRKAVDDELRGLFQVSSAAAAREALLPATILGVTFGRVLQDHHLLCERIASLLA
jgi:hypothetical protein